MPFSTPRRYTHVLLQNEILFSATHAYLSAALSADGDPVLIFNPSPLPTRAQASQIPWENINWLIVNTREAADLLLLLSSPAAATIPLPWSWQDTPIPLHTLQTLLLLTGLVPLKCTNVICTLGALGVVAIIRGPSTSPQSSAPTPIYVPGSGLQGDVRDSTGAGDCFTGYFVRGLMRIWDDERVHGNVPETQHCATGVYETLLRECVQVRCCCSSSRISFQYARRPRECAWRDSEPWRAYHLGRKCC
jgi:ribokinase